MKYIYGYVFITEEGCAKSCFLNFAVYVYDMV